MEALKRIILLITMLLMCGIASAGFQPYDIFAVVWNNETGAPESGVDVTFAYNNQSFTLTTAEDGSVDFTTQNFRGELPDGALVNVSCKYGTKQAQINRGDAGFGITFNEPSESTAIETFAAMGFIAIALGGGLYLLRRKKTIKHEETNMTNETKPFYNSKTMWINVIGIAAIIAQAQFGFIIDAQTQAAILAVVNMILRAVTKQPLSTSS